ncbi:MAG: hypothetical protein ACK4TA_03590 [Saprospiraceae bacterium]
MATKTKVKSVETKKPPILFQETQGVIQEIQAACDGDFLTYWISNGSRIISEDTFAFYKILKERGRRRKLYLFIKSGGGSGTGALRIVNLLRQYYDTIIALVPLDCASAATMLALGADSIQMGSLAYLSAIDTSITHDLSPIDKDNDLVSVSQNELDRVIRLWEQSKQVNDLNPYNNLYNYIHPLVLGAVDRASSLSIKLTTEILSYHMTDLQKAEEISHHLNSNYPSHSYPVTLREARHIGLKVEPLEEKINDKLLLLNEYYSEMAQRAYTDYDERNHHDNEILKIIELEGQQCFYQNDKDWHYRLEERRWIAMNDESSWRRIAELNGKMETSRFYVR